MTTQVGPMRKLGKIYVTLHVFSGRDNPEWMIDQDHKQYEEILKSLGDVRTSKLPLRLGYRGFIIQYEPVAGQKSCPMVVTNNLELESKLITTAPNNLVHSVVAQHVLETIVHRHNERELGIRSTSTLSDPYHVTGTGNSLVGYGNLPVYRPDEWNSDIHAEKLLQNNSYNYANNMVTNTLAQPGRFNHHPKPHPQTGEGWRLNAQEDGLVTIPFDKTNPHWIPKCSDNLVCLVFWPIGPNDEYDFHWYRLDQGGFWSHKLGTHEVTNKDNRDQPIRNPRECFRGVYTEFVTYMSTAPNRVHID